MPIGALQSSPFRRVPPEIVRSICFFLVNEDTKNLRLTCSHFGAIAQLNIPRVFLSPNPRNIEVFLAIADHERLRSQVVEIIWDDSLLLEPESGNAPLWSYAQGRDSSQGEMERFQWTDIERPGQIARAKQVRDMLSRADGWDYYEQLLEQQREILKSGGHVEALNHGLRQFPLLRRITISSAVHGRLFLPLYETPMIRAFPYGFGYPIPTTPNPELDAEWDDEGKSWPGFRAVMRSLAEGWDGGKVTELRLDTHQIGNGLTLRFFDKPSNTFTDFTKVIARPTFRHLHLDLGMGNQVWELTEARLLGETLAGAAGNKGLEYLHLGVDGRFWSYMPSPIPPDEMQSLPLPMPLEIVVPPAATANLKHFGLRNVLVKSHDLRTLLGSRNLETVELSFVAMDGSSYEGLLQQVREDVRHDGYEGPWPRFKLQRAAVYPEDEDRPDNTPSEYVNGSIWVEDEINAFLYGDGENPIGEKLYSSSWVRYGYGVLKDSLDPELERPWVNDDELKRRGLKHFQGYRYAI